MRIEPIFIERKSHIGLWFANHRKYKTKPGLPKCHFLQKKNVLMQNLLFENAIFNETQKNNWFSSIWQFLCSDKRWPNAIRIQYRKIYTALNTQHTLTMPRSKLFLPYLDLLRFWQLTIAAAQHCTDVDHWARKIVSNDHFFFAVNGWQRLMYVDGETCSASYEMGIGDRRM